MTASPEEDRTALLNALLPFAQEMIDKDGEFHPCAAVLDSEGAVQMIGAYAGEDRPDATALVELLYAGLLDRASGGNIRAAAVCANVRLTRAGSGTSDAIQ